MSTPPAEEPLARSLQLLTSGRTSLPCRPNPAGMGFEWGARPTRLRCTRPPTQKEGVFGPLGNLRWPRVTQLVLSASLRQTCDWGQAGGVQWVDPAPSPPRLSFPPRPSRFGLVVLPPPPALSGSRLPYCGKFAVWDGDLGLIWLAFRGEPTGCTDTWSCPPSIPLQALVEVSAEGSIGEVLSVFPNTRPLVTGHQASAPSGCPSFHLLLPKQFPSCIF